MNISFEEKSVWIQLVATALGIMAYAAVATRLFLAGVTALPAYAALFTLSVIFMVVLLTTGHILAAITRRPENRDERDRLIGWNAENRSSWLLAAGILAAMTAMLCSVENVWVAHILLLSLFLSELLSGILRVISYRRGS